mgnify:CR=1 FL=1
MNSGLAVDYWKLEELLQDSLDRLDCLKECHLEEFGYLPDFAFPLQRILQDSLDQIHLAQQVAQAQREQVQE